MSAEKEYFWAPEKALFDNGADACEFLDLGAGCLLANHVIYDRMKRALKDLIEHEGFGTEGNEYWDAAREALPK